MWNRISQKLISQKNKNTTFINGFENSLAETSSNQTEDLKNHYDAIPDNYDDSNLTQLMLACRQDNQSEVEKLLIEGFPVDAIDSDGRTALFYAVTFSSINIISSLLAAKADPFIVAGQYERNCLHQACSRAKKSIEVVRLIVNTMGEVAKLEQDKAGLLPLHLAIFVGERDVCKELLSTHRDEQLCSVTRYYKDAALHLAAKKKDLDILKLLIQEHANINQTNHEGKTPLHILAAESDVESVEYLISQNASGVIADKQNCTPLHIATKAGSIKIVQLLIEKCHANLNERSKDGSTLMHLAAKSGHVEVLSFFLKHKVSVRTPNRNGIEALHEACKRGFSVIVKLLIEHGAQIEKYTKDLYTPLHYAVLHGKYNAAQILIGYGADVNAAGGTKNDTPLHFASKLNRHSDHIIELLLLSGADSSILNLDGESSLHVAVRLKNSAVAKLLIKDGASVIAKNNDGETPLHLSVSNSSILILLLILDEMKKVLDAAEFEKQINATNKLGETALHYCAKISSNTETQTIYTDLTKLLLDNSAKHNLQTLHTAETAVHYCCETGNTKVLQMIFASISEKETFKASNCPNIKGWTPLLIACHFGHLGIVRTLLEHDARLDYFDQDGKTALHIASQSGHISCAELLLEKNAYVDVKTKFGMSSVSLAAANGHSQLFEMLVTKYHAAHSILALNKQSALHLASKNGYIYAVKSLLKLGADPSLVDMDLVAPIHLAAENNHYEVVKLYLEMNHELRELANKDGNTFVHVAAIKGSLEVMMAVLKVDKTMALSKSRNTFQTPLHLSAIYNQSEIVQLLISKGVPLFDEDKNGMTALHLAAQYGSRKVIEVLRGKIPFDVVSQKTGFTPLHIAAEYGQSASLGEFLIKISGDILSQCPFGLKPSETEFGYTCLHLAAKNGHEETVRQLLNVEKIVVEQRTTKNGLIPFHLAMSGGHIDVASLLLSRSAEQINFKCFLGRTALHYAASNYQLKLVRLLIAQGADINEPDNNGMTPLHCAAEAGIIENVIYLVEMGAAPLLCDKDQQIPLLYAIKNRHTEVVSFLMLNKFDVEMLIKDKMFLANLMVCCNLNNNLPAQDLILNSPAPIYAAIKLTLAFRKEAIRIKDKSDDYMEIEDFCEKMAYKILSIATTIECDALLCAVDDYKQTLLDILIDNEFKDCVAQSNIQSFFSDIWNGDLFAIEAPAFLIIAVICFFFPPLWFFLCLPFHRFSKVPTLKFICHLISHFYFTIILILVVAVPWNRSYLELYPPPWEWMLWIWHCAMFLNTITDIEINYFKVVQCMIAASALSLNILAYFMENRVRENVMYARDNVLGLNLLMLFVQFFLEFLAMHEVFGPWTVMIKSLVVDVLKFVFILSLCIVAFTMHGAIIYKPVYNKSQSLTDFPMTFLDFNNVNKGIMDIFSDRVYACFGMGQSPVPLTSDQKLQSPTESYAIDAVSYLLYQIIAVVVLINLLVAMMGSTYSRFEERSTIEWRYTRGKNIWAMTKTNTVPIPVNLITTFILIVQVIFSTYFCCCRANIGDLYQNMSVFEEVATKNVDNNVKPKKGKTKKGLNLREVIDWKKVVEDLKIALNYHPLTLDDYFERLKTPMKNKSSEK
ncbi:serine/threonine-protein phosphatase 6 regulatory ankyrin repeat subunit A isoform X1 [Hydra vulgaris]|uniref:serine/threonine-protein phosphatase 6 regulatory ankyrin repeat subunit A isoform X1 n=1 Tax=Hydra vulgaris TaxID=6087 RepID=UPI001F5F19F2|nr:serine/threonine-protein phosphatase 6 regulatory ankyrin repeat subunit A isoform X1 [Hydra vulgaris]